MKLMISAVALSRFPNASFALAYLFAPCSALEANMFEPISNPISSVPAMICVDPTDMITIVKSPVKNISKFAVLSCCSLRFTLCTVIIIIMNMNIAVIMMDLVRMIVVRGLEKSLLKTIVLHHVAQCWHN